MRSGGIPRQSNGQVFLIDNISELFLKFSQLLVLCLSHCRRPFLFASLISVIRIFILNPVTSPSYYIEHYGSSLKKRVRQDRLDNHQVSSVHFIQFGEWDICDDFPCTYFLRRKHLLFAGIRHQYYSSILFYRNEAQSN